MIDFSGLQFDSVQDVITYPHFVNLTKLRFEPLLIILTTICFLMAVV